MWVLPWLIGETQAELLTQVAQVGLSRFGMLAVVALLVTGIVAAGRNAAKIEKSFAMRTDLFESVVHHQNEFIVRWLPDGTRTFVNEAYVGYFQSPREELIGTSFFPLIAEEDLKSVRDASRKEKLIETELQCIEAVLVEGSHLPGFGKLFINTRARSLSTPGFAGAVRGLVRRHGYRQSDIVLELTEQENALNLRAFDAALEGLHGHGFGFALDDYGSGFANLHLVQHLPLDYLKIDGLFCCGIDADPRKQAIVRSTVELARELGLATIMERVETEAELNAVRELGVDYAQGYYFSAPVPGPELATSFRPVVPTVRLESRVPESRPAILPETLDRESDDVHEVANLLTGIALVAGQGMKKVPASDSLYDDLERIRAASERAVELSRGSQAGEEPGAFSVE